VLLQLHVQIWTYPGKYNEPTENTTETGWPPIGGELPTELKSFGRDSKFGDKNPEDIYGVDGWCQADTNPRIHCDCFLDGLLGDLCEVPVEHYCTSQCSGHGECYLGWCKCYKGYFGHDCAYRIDGIEWDEGLVDGLGNLGEAVLPRFWLADVAHTPAARDVLVKNPKNNKEKKLTRHRPLIYVYELPSKYNQLMLQYRFQRYSCTHRLFFEKNITEFLDSWHYQAETAIHEMLLQSKHRTLDPEEADFFYMPVYISCVYWPVYGAADFPWFHGGPTPNRVAQGTNLLLEMWTWVQSHRPYWDRHGGRDHILLVTHDEGSCHVPAVLRNATILTHWGRKDVNHTSGSAYKSDVYSEELYHPVYQPEGHLKKLGKYPCYDPSKDLVILPIYSPLKYYFSPLHGAPEQDKRLMLAFFKGALRMEDTRMIYSRGIRQKLTNLRIEQKWWSSYKIWIGQTMPADDKIRNLTYGEALSTSIFCFVLPGDGWSGRFEDAIMHGCIPVIIQDEVDVSFESLLDVSEFSLRIFEKDLEKIPEILQAVSKEEIKKLQQGVKTVMRRYWYGSYGPHAMLSQLIREDWSREVVVNAENQTNSSVPASPANDSYAGNGEKEEKKRPNRRRLLDKASEKLDIIDERLRMRLMQQRSTASGIRIKEAMEAATEHVEDDAFETILAFLIEKMKQWE
jgi:Exostosin family